MRHHKIDRQLFPDGLWHDHAFIAAQNPSFCVFSGAFGGWTTAHAMTAALPLMQAEQVPVALTVDFTKGVGPGEVRSLARVVSQSKSTLFAEVHTTQGETLCAKVSAIFSRRRTTDHVALLPAPSAPAPETVAESRFKHPIATWIDQYEMRFVVGRPLQRTPQMRSLMWMRPRPAVAWSWPVLAGFADANFPRIFFYYDTVTPIATVTMSVHFHCTQNQLEALGEDFLLVDASAAIATAGFYDQTVRIWSRAGALVASSTQMAVFNVFSADAQSAP